MQKHLFEVEFEVPVAPAQLFYFISTADGLRLWFAEAVEQTDKNTYAFRWGSEVEHARRVAQRRNQFVRYEFETPEPDDDPPYVEMSIGTNDLTQEVYLTLRDYSADGDATDLAKLYDSVIAALREAAAAEEQSE